MPEEEGRRVDYIMIRCDDHGPTLHIDRCERLFTEPVNGVWASDHFGVVADLSLPSRRSDSWDLSGSTSLRMMRCVRPAPNSDISCRPDGHRPREVERFLRRRVSQHVRHGRKSARVLASLQRSSSWVAPARKIPKPWGGI
ncbi:hypothetical protein J7F01_31745 [Streptomyces sp. ISL-22]|uniref:hypothetical protein n=1 Tax=unclassified Streptomyces TaxID=2593676 RepID=UPI001BE7E376|nr:MULTISPECIES: hypothetical protein [unclassified Streptomyces]MBT2423325.1 hypothetical protein [Streptomyces sp. ISL-24]MBT2436649.1 hypothetical protein [Streptomyces sp. ISL-22]